MLGTGVVIRLATEDEVEAVEGARSGRDFDLETARSYKYVEPARPLGDDEVHVVSQVFVELVDGDSTDRWVSYEHHGRHVSVRDDATLELLKLAENTIVEDLVEDLLSDIRIAGLGVSRRALMSAPGNPGSSWPHRPGGSSVDRPIGTAARAPKYSAAWPGTNFSTCCRGRRGGMRKAG